MINGSRDHCHQMEKCNFFEKSSFFRVFHMKEVL
jgi:calcineurin-like phosphoesterase family protein